MNRSYVIITDKYNSYIKLSTNYYHRLHCRRKIKFSRLLYLVKITGKIMFALHKYCEHLNKTDFGIDQSSWNRQFTCHILPVL